MSSTTPLRFGAPEPVEQHAVLASFVTGDRQFTDVVVLSSAWGTAVAVQTELENVRLHGGFGTYLGPELNSFCVRSVNDPRVKNAVSGDRFYALSRSTQEHVSRIGTVALGFQREYTRKRVGELARDAVADESLTTLSAVIRRVREDSTREGLSQASVDAQSAVKSRIVVGRVSTGYRYNDRGHAYFIRKKDAPLHSILVDGRHLNQTTLAYRGEFTRIPSADIVRKEYHVA